MKVRPGRKLVRLFGSLVGWSLLAFVWPATIWLVPPAIAVLAALAWSDYRKLKASFGQVRVTRELPVLTGRDRVFSSVLRIVNQNPSTLRGDVRDVIPAAALPNFEQHAVQIPPGNAPLELRQQLRIPIRGRYDFGPVWLRLQSNSGLLEAQQPFACSGTVRVLPEGFASRAELSKNPADEIRMLDRIIYSRQHGVGTEFESLTEYREGDDPRRIDWRTTARYGRPIVRRYQIERHRDLMLVLDCGRLMGTDAGQGTKLDCAVDATLMLGRVALAGGDRCGLGIFDDQVRGYLPPIAGAQALRILTESLYSVQPRWLESDFGPMFGTLQLRQAKRALVVILSDIVDVETSLRYRASLATFARRHVVLFAALRTPLLRKLQHIKIHSILDGSRAAVAYRIAHEREVAIHSLRRSGVHVLDVEPAQLSVPLVNQFLQLRQRNLL